METKLSPRDTHYWISRRLEVVSGQPLVHQVCRHCSRGFIENGSTGEIFAAHASVFAFHRLSDEVTSRWLSEKCPGERLKKDDADRDTRFVRDSFIDHSTPLSGETLNDDKRGQARKP
jgi:hypothetical protein